jgi:EAL domain-containing protein (putative c-di-GMP-specific phosphodiesterase class I)
LPFVVGDDAVMVTASVGAASWESGSTADTLLRDADVAMYVSKARGKGHHVLFEASMHFNLSDRLRMRSDLLTALATDDQLFVMYQPIYSMSTAEVVGMEALVRWQHPRRGLLQPDEFLAMAEETGLIVPLGEYLLRAACAQMAVWSARYRCHVALSVNVSCRQFEVDLGAMVRRVLEDSQLHPSMLVLELTETAIMRDAAEVAVTLADLQRQGVRVAVDDVGTGYSSLAYLEEFPVDFIKIDRQFVSGPKRPNARLVVADAMVRLGHSLGVQVVAEGIEEQWQADHLRESGCDFVQGFLYSSPLRTPEMEALLREASPMATPGPVSRR